VVNVKYKSGVMSLNTDAHEPTLSKKTIKDLMHGLGSSSG